MNGYEKGGQPKRFALAVNAENHDPQTRRDIVLERLRIAGIHLHELNDPQFTNPDLRPREPSVESIPFEWQKAKPSRGPR